MNIVSGEYYVKADDVTLSSNATLNFSFKDYLSLIGYTGDVDKVNLRELITSYRQVSSDDFFSDDYIVHGSTNPVKLFGGTRPASAAYNNWAVIATINTMFCENSANNPGKMLLPGTFPGFPEKLNEVLYEGSASGTITIERTSSQLKFGNSYYDSSSFPDGVIPLRIIVELQAPGGGGGGNRDNASGGGGGAGGYSAFVLDLKEHPKVSITLGAPGAGGKGSLSASTGAAHGKNGGTCTVTDTSTNTTLISVFGGNGGYEGDGTTGGDGRDGGSYSHHSSMDKYIIKEIKGGYGSNGNNNSKNSRTGNGETISSFTLYLDYDKATNSFLTNNETIRGNQSGGTRGRGGGGGASVFGDGGNGGDGNNGNDGGFGAGGGGGSYKLASYLSGGDGGNPYCLIYY